ncbi:hypothetical protein ACB092_04G085800 [Castanea dentata]
MGSELMGLKLDLGFEMGFGFRLWLEYGFQVFNFSFSSGVSFDMVLLQMGLIWCCMYCGGCSGGGGGNG